MPDIQRKKRLEYIDAAKAISIMMIMMGHITSLSNDLDTWMSSIKITIFYVISGFLMAYTGALHKRTPAQFVRNLLSTLMWPYFVFSVLAIPVKTAFEYWSEGKASPAWMEMLTQSIKEAVFFAGINSMWFIPTLFIGELIILLLYKMPKIVSVIYGFVALLSVWAANNVIAMIDASGLGELGKEAAIDLIRTGAKGVAAGWFIGFGYLVYLLMVRKDFIEGHFIAKLGAGTVLTVSNAILCMSNKRVDFNNLSLGDKPVLFFYGGVAGTMGMILLMDAVSQKISLETFGYWGKNALIIMCTHVPFRFLALAKNGWKHTAYIPKTAGSSYLLHCFFILGVLLLMMYSVIEIINRYFPWMTRFPARSKK